MSTLAVIAAVNFTRVPMEFSLNSGGAGPWTITLTGHHCHQALSAAVLYRNGVAVAMTPAITSIASKLKPLMDDSPSALTFTVTFNVVTGKYTISATGAFDLTFAGLGDLSTPSGRAAAMLGFTSNKSAQDTYESDVVCRYFMFAGNSIEAKSKVTDDDATQYSETAESDDGKKTYGTSSDGTVKKNNFQIQHQPKALVWTRHKTGASNPIRAAEFTYEEFFEHVITHEHFAVYDESLPSGVQWSIHKLRDDGAYFEEGQTRFRVEDEVDVSWHIQFLTYLFGRF